MSEDGRWSFRRARPDDAPAVAALHADSWRRNYRGAYSDAFLDHEVDTDRLVVWTGRLTTDDGSTATVVAEADGELVAFVHVVFDADPDWGTLVDNLHVAHARRRSGVGTRLMAEAAGAVARRDRGGLVLWVLEQNASAQAFYETLGGRRVERAAVGAPGGVADRLVGAPAKLRYAWADPAVLSSRPSRRSSP